METFKFYIILRKKKKIESLLSMLRISRELMAKVYGAAVVSWSLPICASWDDYSEMVCYLIGRYIAQYITKTGH